MSRAGKTKGRTQALPRDWIGFLMTKDELERAIKVGRSPLCVDASRLEAFPGIVREVTILRDLRVMIEFNPYGYDEGGPRYVCSYADVDTVVQRLESYFGKPLACWENHNATGRYPEPLDGWTGASEAEAERFRAAVAARTLPLAEGDYEQESSYWMKIEGSHDAQD